MAGKFISYAVTTTQEEFYQIYVFINASGQNVLRFVTESAQIALHNGTTFVASFANAAACPNNAYMVIEPVTANGSQRWQCQIKLPSTTGALTGKVAPRGGWTTASGFGAAIVTGDVNINDGSSPAASSAIYCGCDTESYNAGANTYTYLWFMVKDGSAADQFFYVGGYDPVDPADDPAPVCMLNGGPTLDGGNNTVSTALTTSNNRNRGPTEYAHTTTWVGNGYACIRLADGNTNAPGSVMTNRNFAGKRVANMLSLFTVTPAGQHGTFRDHMLSIDTSMTNFDTNVATSYIVFGDLLVYYNTAL